MGSRRIILTEKQLSRIVNSIVKESIDFADFTHKGSPNQALGKKSKAPNTGDEYFGPLFTNDIGYDKSITNNMDYHTPKVFKGVNPSKMPNTNDKQSKLKVKDNFMTQGTQLKTHKGTHNIKIGNHFVKDMKKGKVRKNSSKKHADLHPKRHSSSEKTTNIVHKNNITRGGVVFDSKFKAGKGADPFTIKT